MGDVDQPARIDDLIARSSLGTPEAVALRASVPDERAARVVARSKEIALDNRASRWLTSTTAYELIDDRVGVRRSDDRERAALSLLRLADARPPAEREGEGHRIGDVDASVPSGYQAPMGELAQRSLYRPVVRADQFAELARVDPNSKRGVALDVGGQGEQCICHPFMHRVMERPQVDAILIVPTNTDGFHGRHRS